MAFLIRKFHLVMVLQLLVFVFQTQVYADDQLNMHEQEIKAGLLYNFLKYIDWPSDSEANSVSQINVCVFGDDPFNDYLKPMNGRSVNKKEIKLDVIHNTNEIGECRLLFINSSYKDKWPDIIRYVFGKSIVTVSDFKKFTDYNGMIEFGRKDEHISVFMNMEAIMAAHLHVQYRLLKLVTVVSPSSSGLRKQ